MSNQKSGWNKIYQNPDDYSYYNVLVPHTNLGEVIEWFKSMRVNTVLDLGCGMGRNLFPLLEAGFDAYGIDNAEYGIKHIWTELDKKNLSKKIVLGKFQNLPFKDNHFDAIISIQTLNHGYESDIIQGINEIKRVLRPGGYFFITVPGRISQGKVRYCLVKTAQRVEPHTYLPTIGDEVGIPHFILSSTHFLGLESALILVI